MIWALAAGAVVAVLGLVLWLARTPGTPAWHDPARSEDLRSVLAGRGMEAQVASKAPSPMPQLRLPLAWSFRSRAGAEAAAAGARWLLYDTETRGRAPVGCNSGPSSSPEDPISRHTVVAVDSTDPALLSFTLVPNVRQQLERALVAALTSGLLARWSRSTTYQQ